MQELPGFMVRKLVLRISLRLFLIIAVLLILTLVVPPLLNLFLPFVLAFLVASMLAPLVKRLSKKMGKAWHFWSILFILLLILAVTGLLGYVIYYLVTQIADLIGSWDAIQISITETINRLSEFLDGNFHLTSTDVEEYFLGLLQTGLTWISDKISTWAPTLVSSVSSIASSVASFVVSLLFFIIAAYFMTADYPNLREKLRKAVPTPIHPHMSRVKEVMNSAMFGYLRAQFILSGIVGLIIFVALSIWGQSYSLLIALATAIIDVIPFFGSGIVLIPWAVVSALWGNYSKAIFLLILSFVLFLFRKLAEPKVVGNQTGLSPLLSVISIYVGMKIGGVLGMILCPILCMMFIGLYNTGFFDPTISDFKLLGKHLIAVATLRPSDFS